MALFLLKKKFLKLHQSKAKTGKIGNIEEKEKGTLFRFRSIFPLKLFLPYLYYFDLFFVFFWFITAMHIEDIYKLSSLEHQKSILC